MENPSLFFFPPSSSCSSQDKTFLHFQSLLKMIPWISEKYSALKHNPFLNLIKEPLAAEVCRNETVIYWRYAAFSDGKESVG